MTDRIMRRPDVEFAVGLKRSAIYSMMAKGRFPSPVKIGERAVGWRQSAITAWINSRGC
jgi:prophage regulatory protein